MSNIAVFFFAGYYSTTDQMERWEVLASCQMPKVTFKGFAYPAHLSDSPEISTLAGRKDLQEAIRLINDSQAASIFIVGHSSGCRIADWVETQVKTGADDRKKQSVTLIVLDGFQPSADQLKSGNTHVWYAQSTDGRKKTSRNADSFVGANYNQANLHRYDAKYATTRDALHFSLVNSEFTDDMIALGRKEAGNFAGLGYGRAGKPSCDSAGSGDKPAKPDDGQALFIPNLKWLSDAIANQKAPAP